MFANTCSPKSHIYVLFYTNLFKFLTLSFLTVERKWKWKWSCSVVSDSLWPYGVKPTRLLCPWVFPGKNTEVGCHFLLQGIFPTQGSNSVLPHCGQNLHRLSYERILSWYYYLIYLQPTCDISIKSKRKCLQSYKFSFISYISLYLNYWLIALKNIRTDWVLL